ncbi:MAG TPA: hypothetical protein VHU83_00825 [Bryobacteraceae bacterium]|jgi:hypothetical protein|nr:hypothetical protein [Bryobacteraceae bacterium]
MPESDEDRPYRPPSYTFSTGPKSPEGKAASSQNATKHGCCSNKLILPDEDEQEWNDLKQGWMDDYNPHTHAARALVYDAAVAQWLLLRARRRYYEAEWSIYSELPDPIRWADAHHQKIERFTRYRTTAERAFTRALNNLERLRKTRQQEVERALRHEQRAAEMDARRKKNEDARRHREISQPPQPNRPEKPPKTAAQQTFQGQKHAKKQRKIPVLEQWVQVTVEDGQTVTRFFPPNEELIEQGQTMDPPPELVYRRLEFIGGIPPEYHWSSSSHPERFQTGGAGLQRMTVDTWLEVIEREKASGAGHIGSTGIGNLPRPKERGGCACEICTHNREILESRREE